MATLIRPRRSPRSPYCRHHQRGCSSAAITGRPATINPAVATGGNDRSDGPQRRRRQPFEPPGYDRRRYRYQHRHRHHTQYDRFAPTLPAIRQATLPFSKCINFRMVSVETRCVAASDDSRIYTSHTGGVPAVSAAVIRPFRRPKIDPGVRGISIDNNDDCCSG